MKISDENHLLCPGCGYNYLHCSTVETFDRMEDMLGAPGMHVTVAGSGALSVDRDISRNPSGRRDGCILAFYCEGCDAISELHISQHKGNTEVTFAVVRQAAAPEVS